MFFFVIVKAAVSSLFSLWSCAHFLFFIFQSNIVINMLRKPLNVSLFLDMHSKPFSSVADNISMSLYLHCKVLISI